MLVFAGSSTGKDFYRAAAKAFFSLRSRGLARLGGLAIARVGGTAAEYEIRKDIESMERHRSANVQ